MKKYFLFLISTTFSIASLYSMQNKDHVEKLQQHINRSNPTTQLSQLDIQFHSNTLSNQIRYLQARKKLDRLENLPYGPLSNITELKKVETRLQAIAKSGYGLEPQELTRVHKVLLPYIAILISTDQLFQSTKPSDIKKFLPLSEADIQKKFKPFDCLQRNARGDTILQHAVNIKSPVYTLRYLIACGQSTNDANYNKQNAVHSAVLTNNTEALETLLSYQRKKLSLAKDTLSFQITKEIVEINAQDSLGQTPLHKACIQRFDNCIRRLILHNASVTITDCKGKKAVDYLFDQPWTHASTLICRGILAIYKPDAISSQYHDILEKIQKADEKKLQKITQEIIEKLKPCTMKRPRKKTKKKTVHTIASQSIPTSKIYATKIFQALEEDKLTQSLLEHETTSIDTVNNVGETPLCWAILHKPHFCSMLLQQKANPNKVSSFVPKKESKLMLTPLEHAAMLQEPLASELMELLLLYNANPNSAIISPPLHSTAYMNDYEKISLLLKYKADIDLLDFTGETALHTACKVSAGKSIITLLLNGADPNIKNTSDGKTTLDYCYENKESDFILLLLAYGAKIFSKKIFLNDKEMDLTQPKNYNIFRECILLNGIKIQVILDKKGIHLKLS